MIYKVFCQQCDTEIPVIAVRKSAADDPDDVLTLDIASEHLHGDLGPGRWFRINSPDGHLWMETSDEQEARDEAQRTGWPLLRLFVLQDVEQRSEWRPA